MATIYRFVIEQKTSGGGKGGGGVKGTKKAKEPSDKQTSKSVSLLKYFNDGNKGGVGGNRKTRAVNPLINKLTAGYWEKGTRLGRAGAGLVKVNSETGEFAGLSGPAIAVIIAMIIQTVLNHHNKLIQRTDRENKLNYKAYESGRNANHGQYAIANDLWSGKISYNENR